MSLFLNALDKLKKESLNLDKNRDYVNEALTLIDNIMNAPLEGGIKHANLTVGSLEGDNRKGI